MVDFDDAIHMTITVWWFELRILGGRLTRLTLLFSKYFDILDFRGSRKMRRRGMGLRMCELVGTAKQVWEFETSFKISRSQNKLLQRVADSGRVLATSRYSQRIWIWATAGPYLQTLCIWLMCVSTRSSGRRVLAEIFYPVFVRSMLARIRTVKDWSALLISKFS